MFKFFALFALIAVSKASLAPYAHHTDAIVKSAIISEPGHIAVQEPTIARVGDYVESVPSAVSHQSSTVVHSRANIVTPIVAPAVRTHIAPVVKTYEAPIVHAEPIVKTYGAPLVKTIETAPAITYAAPAITKTVHYASEPVITGHTETILKPKLEAPIAAPAFRAAPALAIPALPALPTITKSVHFGAEPILARSELLKTRYEAPIFAEPALHAAPALAIPSLPAITKSVHLASEPIISGYRSELLKPRFDAPIFDQGLRYAAAPTITKSLQLTAEPALTGYSTELLKPRFEGSLIGADHGIRYAYDSEPLLRNTYGSELLRNTYGSEPLLRSW